MPRGQLTRRYFVTCLGGSAAAWPLAARAQQAERMRRIGMLAGQAEADPDMQARLDAFRHGLQGLGWVEGPNLHIDYRFTDGREDRFQPLAKELVALRPELTFVQSTPGAAAVQRESRTLPIVFVNVSDPIGSGFVASLARPGGNLTGVLLYEASITGNARPSRSHHRACGAAPLAGGLHAQILGRRRRPHVLRRRPSRHVSASGGLR